MSDGKLTGTYTRDGEETPIQEAKLVQNQLTFKLQRRFRENDVNLNYSGQVRGDVLRGHYTFGENGSDWVTLWEAERETAKD